MWLHLETVRERRESMSANPRHKRSARIAAKQAGQGSRSTLRAPTHGPGSRARDLGVLAVLVAIGLTVLLLFGSRDRSGFAEEAIPFRQALTLWGWGDAPPTANPHFFSYGSLSIYWHWLVQCFAVLLGLTTGRYGAWADAGVEVALAPHYLVFAGRASMATFLVMAGWIAYRWSSSASWAVGALAGISVCLAPALVRSTIQMPPEALMSCFSLLASLALRRAREGGVAAAAAVGLVGGALCGTKYSALPFVAFSLLALAVWGPLPGGAPRRVLAALLAAGLAFFVTTPYALLAPAEFTRDVGFELDHLARGHLGGSPVSTALAHAGQLWRALGPASAIALVGYVLLRPLRPQGAGLLLVGACAYVIPACLSSSGGPERYIVPAIPMLVLFAWEVTRAALLAPHRGLRALGLALVALGVAQLAMNIPVFARSTGPSPVAAASEWLRANARPEDIVVQDHGSVAVFDVDQRDALLRSACLRDASEVWRTRAMSAVAHTVIAVPFVAAGQLYAEVEVQGSQRRRVVLFDPAWNLVPAMYSVLDEVPVQFVVRNSGIEGRLATVFGPSVDGGARRPGAERILETFRAPKGALFDDAEVTMLAGSGSSPGRSTLGVRWWLGDAVPRDAMPAPSDSAAYEIAIAHVYGERVRPFLASLGQGALRRGDGGALARAARLMLISEPGDALAVRFALLGLDANRADSVWDAGGRTVVRRSVGESDPAWRARVVRAWGVDEAMAGAESQRFENWKRSNEHPPNSQRNR